MNDTHETFWWNEEMYKKTISEMQSEIHYLQMRVRDLSAENHNLKKIADKVWNDAE